MAAVRPGDDAQDAVHLCLILFIMLLARDGEDIRVPAAHAARWPAVAKFTSVLAQQAAWRWRSENPASKTLQLSLAAQERTS